MGILLLIKDNGSKDNSLLPPLYLVLFPLLYFATENIHYQIPVLVFILFSNKSYFKSVFISLMLET